MRTFTQALPAGGALAAYLHDASDVMPNYKARPAVIVCPGGGYEHLSDRESDPAALQFCAAGYQAFVLRYTLREQAANWRPVIELAQAIAALRAHAAEWGVLPQKIAVCGFSAGGHLAACSDLLWDAPAVQAAVPGPNGENRPNALILCYPVVSSGPKKHAGSFAWIAGEDEALRRAFSLEHQVRPGAAPVFLWHTVEDETVPVENSLLLAQALRAAGVPFELHLFQRGCHGMSLCTAEVNAPAPHPAQWFPLCREWLDETFAFSAR